MTNFDVHYLFSTQKYLLLLVEQVVQFHLISLYHHHHHLEVQYHHPHQQLVVNFQPVAPLVGLVVLVYLVVGMPECKRTTMVIREKSFE